LVDKIGSLNKVILVAKSPRLAFAKFLQYFYPIMPLNPEVSPLAHIAKTAIIGKNCCIEAGAVIGENVRVGEGSWIRANAVIGNNVVLGSRVIVGATAVITYALVGDDCVIEAGTKIGQYGFGYVMSPAGHTFVPQMGRVILQNKVEIGANCTIDRGALEDTIIGEGTKLNNLVHIAHACKIGKHCVITGQVGIAGSSELGDFVVMAGQSGVADHTKVGTASQIGAQAGVTSDLPPMSKVTGYPATPVTEFFRQVITLKNLTKKGNKS